MPTLTRTTRNVLVIGRLPAVNQRVIARLEARGYAAVGAAGQGTFDALDARGFDLVAIGAGVDPDTRAALRQRFQAQHPGVLLLDAYGPLAAEQVDTALRRAAGAPICLESLVLAEAGELQRIDVTVRRACRLQLDIYRHRGSPDPEVLPVAAADVIAGTHLFAVARALTGPGHMLVARADDEVSVQRLFPG